MVCWWFVGCARLYAPPPQTGDFLGGEALKTQNLCSAGQKNPKISDFGERGRVPPENCQDFMILGGELTEVPD